MQTESAVREAIFPLDAFPEWARLKVENHPGYVLWLTGTLWARLLSDGRVVMGSTTEDDPHPALLR